MACVRLLIHLLLVLTLYNDADEIRAKIETKGTIFPFSQLKSGPSQADPLPPFAVPLACSPFPFSCQPSLVCMTRDTPACTPSQ